MPDVNTITLPAFIASRQLAMRSTRATDNPNALAVWADQPGARHWRCLIYRHGPAGAAAIDASEGGGPSMEVPFTQGAAHTRPPTLEDVLDCIASDARSVEAYAGTGARAWIEWADEYGMLDAQDGRTTAERVGDAWRTWDVIEGQLTALRQLLGDADYRVLIERVEPL